MRLEETEDIDRIIGIVSDPSYIDSLRNMQIIELDRSMKNEMLKHESNTLVSAFYFLHCVTNECYQM